MQILIIDDEPDILENVSEALGYADYEVLTATTGLSGIESAKEHLPALILCDLMLPGLDGYGVLTELRNMSQFRLTPIIMMSGKAEHKIITKTLEMGASDFLGKPFSLDLLLTTIAKHLK